MFCPAVAVVGECFFSIVFQSYLCIQFFVVSLRKVSFIHLPHGFQRLLSIAIVVAANPELILLDEVVSGMNAEEIKKTMQILSQIHSEGKTFILIEHNMRVAMNFCERFIVLNYGKNIAEGSPKEISNNEQVINAYLGSKKKYPKRQ